MRSQNQPLLIAYLIANSVVAVSLTACQQPESSLPPMLDELAKTTGSEAQANSSSQTTAEPVFPSHLKQVCQGEPAAQAASYQTSKQATHPTYLVYREQPDDAYLDQSKLGLLPAAWEKEWRNLNETELVLCVNRLQHQPTRKCEFKEAGQPTYVLEMYNTLYSAELREASTGTVVAYQEMQIDADAACPKKHMFTADEPRDRLDADYTQAIYQFAQPYVETVIPSEN